MDYEISVEEQKALLAAVAVGDVPHAAIGDFLREAFGLVMGAATAQGVSVCGPPLSRYDLTEAGFHVEAGFPIAAPLAPGGSVEVIELPAGPAATTVHVGSYETLAGAYRALEAWMAANGHVPAGAPWETYLDGPGVAEPRTVVTWPVLG